MKSLVGYPLSGLFGVMTLVDDVADLLAVHDEVDAIRGQSQEGVVDVMQRYSFGLWLSDDARLLQVKVSDAARHRQPAIDVRLPETVPGDEPPAFLYPLLLIPSFRGVVDSQLKSLAFAAQHGATVPHAGDHQLDAVPQQGHGGGGSRVHSRPYRDKTGTIGKRNEEGKNKKQ